MEFSYNTYIPIQVVLAVVRVLVPQVARPNPVHTPSTQSTVTFTPTTEYNYYLTQINDDDKFLNQVEERLPRPTRTR